MLLLGYSAFMTRDDTRGISLIPAGPIPGLSSIDTPPAINVLENAVLSKRSDFSNVCDPDLPPLQTDGRTDRRHAISIPRFAL